MAIFTEQIKLLIDADSKGAVRPLGQLETQAKKTETAFDRMAKSVGLSSSTLKTGLVAGATAYIGTNLVQYLEKSVNAYAGGAKAAADLANATGASVDEVSRMTAALQDAGVGAEQAATLLTKFTTSVGGSKGAAALEALNVALVTNKNGTVDYAATMVQAVDAIGQLGDSAERNAALVALFGKAGAKSFQDLYNSGIKLSDAMAAIEKYRVFTPDDVKAAMEYDDAMDSLIASSQGLQFALGRGLAPALTDLANLATPLVEAFAAIPPEMLLTVGAAVALNRVITAQLIASALPAATTGAYVLAASLVSPKLGFDLLGVAATRAGAAMKAAFLSNPVGWIVLALGSAYVANEKFKDSLAETGDEVDRLVQSGLAFEDAMASALGLTREAADKVKGDPILGPVYEAQADAARKAAEERKALSDEQGAGALVAKEDSNAQKALKDMLASGVYSQQELADAVNDAGQAQLDQNQVTKQAKDLMDAYAASTWDAVNATLAQIDKNYAQNRAVREYHEQVKETNKILNDGKKSQEEKNQALDDLGMAALNAANALVELKSQEALLAGTTLSAKEKNDILIASLKERKREASTKAERDEIDALIRKLQSAQVTAGETFIEIGGIKFKEGTTEDQVNKLKLQIAQAASTGNVGLATSLQAELDALKVPDLPMKVTLVGSDGKTPLTGEQSVTINTTTPGAAEAATTLTNLVNPAEPYEAKINTKVYGWFAAEAILNGLAKDRYSRIFVTTVPIQGGSQTDPANPAGRTSFMGELLSPARSGVSGGNVLTGGAGGTAVLAPPARAARQDTTVVIQLDGRTIARYLDTSKKGA